MAICEKSTGILTGDEMELDGGATAIMLGEMVRLGALDNVSGTTLH